MPDRYRPTLFDFLAYEALRFYSLAEQRARPQGAFDLSADSPALADRADFLTWQLPDDNDSPIVKSLHLYQALLEFHQNDNDLSALLDSDLSRLEYAHDEAYGEEKVARYRAALQRLLDRHRNHESSAWAWRCWPVPTRPRTIS